MPFTPVNPDTWARREYLAYFQRTAVYITLPVGAEFSHAVSGGLHISRFFQQLEATAAQLIPN